MTQSLADLLKDVVKKYHLQGEMDKARLPNIWQEVVGHAIARRSTVIGFEEGQLIIRVRESVWRSEISLRREELRQKMNVRIGSEMIREIVLR